MMKMFDVFVYNDHDEQMTFTLYDIHDALSLYYAIIRDKTVYYVSIISYHVDDNGNYFDSETIRIYGRD